jgi:adenosylhomocysteine nucleosidase
MKPIKRFVQKHSRIKENEVVFCRTGVGKVNSYKHLKKILDITKDYVGDQEYEITVLNIGTAASVNEKPGTVVWPSRYIDRDLVRIGDKYLEKSEYWIGAETGNKEYSCNSGDTFVTNPEEAYQIRDGFTAVCDMEAFQQARLCMAYPKKPINFVCAKFITDKIGDNSVKDWEDMLGEARKALTYIASRYICDTYRD